LFFSEKKKIEEEIKFYISGMGSGFHCFYLRSDREITEWKVYQSKKRLKKLISGCKGNIIVLKRNQFSKLKETFLKTEDLK